MTNSNQGIIEACGKNTYLVKLLKEYYEKEAVFAATDKYREHFYVKIDSFDDYVGIYFCAKDVEYDAQAGLLEFCNEVINQQLKRDLNKQYGSLRDKIYTFAFEPINK